MSLNEIERPPVFGDLGQREVQRQVGKPLLEVHFNGCRVKLRRPDMRMDEGPELCSKSVETVVSETAVNTPQSTTMM